MPENTTDNGTGNKPAKLVHVTFANDTRVVIPYDQFQRLLGAASDHIYKCRDVTKDIAKIDLAVLGTIIACGIVEPDIDHNPNKT